MTDDLIDKHKKIKELKELQARSQTIEAPPPICPFMSSPEREVSCSPRCKLFRGARRGYECYFMELQSISYNVRPLIPPSPGSETPPP